MGASPPEMTLGALRLSAEDLVPDQALRRADRDKFNHAAIARRLADLVLAVDTPTNVALFGPWGSGKSSVYELLRRALDDIAPSRVKLIRYDAWKYGGESLQRNFISHAATELGFDELKPNGRHDPDNRRFHRGLYERQRRADVDFGQLRWRGIGPLLFFAALFVSLVVVFAALVGLASILTREDFFGEIARTLPDFVVSTGVVAALVAAVKVVLDGAKVEVEQSQPGAEEEFAKTFRDLLTRAHEKKGYRRFVFFVDELDRCSRDDVVKTLTAIRTFLDQEDCVFVVAADRDVLERALDGLPQSVPVDEENPYYSSASAFFDKVFQHQMPLPPLRGRRLTRFARDLTSERGGLWRRLRESTTEGQSVDRVIYALIPSHVRSPRRVKVLLNAFATNVRVAESRNIDWRARATEIAKLTVLQTEFPLLAADLHQEPRLPSYLITPPIAPSPRIEKLLRRHGGTMHSSGITAEDVADAVPPDPTLVTDSEEADQLKATQHTLLRRYLERTADVQDPGRDLLYLEAAGAAFGLEDAALGELIESDAPEAPSRVTQAVASRSPDEQVMAIRVLADMCDQEFGQERANVMTALMGTVEVLDDRLPEVAGTVAAAIRSYEEEQSLEDSWLLGALRVALALDAHDGRPLSSSLFARPSLLSPDRLGRVAALLPAVPPEFREKVYERIAEEFPNDRSVLTEPLSALPEDAARQLFEAGPVAKVLGQAYESEQATAVAEELYEATGHAPALAQELQRKLLMVEGPYPAVRQYAEKVIQTMTETTMVDEHAILALDWAPPEDWGFWVSFLSDGKNTTRTLGDWATYGVRSILRRHANDLDAPGDPEEALEKLTPFLREASEDSWARVTKRIEEILGEREWWTSEGARATQEALHRTIRQLRQAPNITLAVDDLLVADLSRSAEATLPATAELPERPARTGSETLLGLLEMGTELGPDSAAQLKAQWDEASPPEEGPAAYQLTHALVALAITGRGAGAQFDVDSSRIVAAMNSTYGGRIDLLVRWLQSGPRPRVVARVLDSRLSPAGPARDAMQRYAESLSDRERTALVMAVVDTSADPGWVETLSQYGVDDDALARRLIADALDASRVDDRERHVRLLVAVRPGTPRSQRMVADLIISLLERDRRGDFNVAVRAVDALSTQHRSTERLRNAFVRAAADNDFRVPPKGIEALAQVGVRLPKKSVPENALKTLRKLFGGK